MQAALENMNIIWIVPNKIVGTGIIAWISSSN